MVAQLISGAARSRKSSRPRSAPEHLANRLLGAGEVATVAVMKRPRIAIPLLAAVVLCSASAVAFADNRDDFLAGKTNDCPKCNLDGIDIKYRDLGGANLAGADLNGANMHRVNLANANLSG